MNAFAGPSKIVTAAIAAVFLLGVTQAAPPRGICGIDARAIGAQAYYDRSGPNDAIAKRYQVRRIDASPSSPATGWPTIGYVYQTHGGAYVLAVPSLNEIVVPIAGRTPDRIRAALHQAMAYTHVTTSTWPASPVYKGILDGSTPIAALPCPKLR